MLVQGMAFRPDSSHSGLPRIEARKHEVYSDKVERIWRHSAGASQSRARFAKYAVVALRALA